MENPINIEGLKHCEKCLKSGSCEKESDVRNSVEMLKVIPMELNLELIENWPIYVQKNCTMIELKPGCKL